MALPLDAVTPQTLIGGNPFQPFWSPDGRSIAYFSPLDLKLWRADIGGGPPQIITDAQPPDLDGHLEPRGRDPVSGRGG